MRRIWLTPKCTFIRSSVQLPRIGQDRPLVLRDMQEALQPINERLDKIEEHLGSILEVFYQVSPDDSGVNRRFKSFP